MQKLYVLLVVLFLSTCLTAAFAAPVNINTATAEEISESLVGVGLKKATAIVEYRQQYGEFKTMNELVNVKGIGVETIEKNKTNILIETN